MWIIFIYLIFVFAILGVGMVLFFSLQNVPSEQLGVPTGFEILVQYGIPGIFIVIGLLMLLQVIRSLFTRMRKKRLLLELHERGIKAKARVTFVDRNYGILINNRPIYSIVEYEYVDDLGRQQTKRLTNIPTDVIIRHVIEVGTEIDILFHPERTHESAWTLRDEDATPSPANTK